GIDADERVDATAGAAVDDAHEPANRLGREVERKVGDHQDAIRLCHLASVDVVLFDRLKLVAEVLLDDVIHVHGQVCHARLDVGSFSPDAAGDQGLVVIGQVHERGEVPSQPHRVDDGEACLARRQTGQQAEHHRLEYLGGLNSAFVPGTDEHGTR